MEIPAIVKEHLGKLVGGGSAGAGGAFVFFSIFKDGIKDMLAEWRKSREEARDERRARRAVTMSEAGNDGRAMGELLKMLKEMIAQQAAQEKETIALLGQMATSHERTLDVQRTFSNQLHDVDAQLRDIKTLAGIAASRPS